MSDSEWVLAVRFSFVPMVQKDQHIERSSLCTVFLDTLLVNAHTVGKISSCGCNQIEIVWLYVTT
jgi:hypothetical protein